MALGTYAPKVDELVAMSAAGQEESVPALERGRSLYLNRCTHCHRLYDITRLERIGFRTALERMEKKAELSDNELESILGYLEAVSSFSAARAKEPEGH